MKEAINKTLIRELREEHIHKPLPWYQHQGINHKGQWETKKLTWFEK